jgi:DNA-nicking Smr family endonuclease
MNLQRLQRVEASALPSRSGDPPGPAERMEVQITYSPWTESSVLDWTDQAAQATFDLHGQTVSEAAVNVDRFLRAQARVRPGAVVRLITGRGRAGGGAPIRTRVRTMLRALREREQVVRDFVLEDSGGSFLVRLRQPK